MIQTVYLGTMFSMFALGAFNFIRAITTSGTKQNVKFKRRTLTQRLIKEDSQEMKDLDLKFQHAGLSLTGKQYQLMRYVLLLVLMVMWTTKLIVERESSMMIVWGIGLFLITSPKEKIMGFNSPFSKLLESRSKKLQEKKDIELYNIVSQLKNICLSTQGTMGTDYVLNEIIDYTKYTRPVFTKFISLWNIDRRKEAVEHFNDNIGSLLGQELSAILYKFDSLDGIEIVKHLDLYQNSIREEKETHRVRSQEKKTTLLYFSAISIVVLIMINLIVTFIFSNLADQILFNM